MAQDYAPCSFLPVADALESRCGSLDCHGQKGRNLRIYGLYGLREKDPIPDPGAPSSPPPVTGVGVTNRHEYDLTYLSVISIQPEVLSRVFADHGANPERWIVFSKGSGNEHHKGGTAMPRAIGVCTDKSCAASTCVESWLRGNVSDAACRDAAEFLAPEPP